MEVTVPWATSRTVLST